MVAVAAGEDTDAAEPRIHHLQMQWGSVRMRILLQREVMVSAA